jgi:catechol 2,3-dioxygenase-like lactoylglutathione lyase family enzyme
MMAQVKGLGHVGIYVRDLERMVEFYRDTLGMRVTKQNWRAGMVFLSADPEGADHEVALFRGRPEDADSRLINQISLRVETLDDLRVMHKSLVAAGLRIDALVNHVSALGCYYFDPEGNRSEVFWVTGRACWVPIAHLIDIHQSDEAVMAEVDALWERLRHVGMGERMANEPATLQLD